MFLTEVTEGIVVLPCSVIKEKKTSLKENMCSVRRAFGSQSCSLAIKDTIWVQECGWNSNMCVLVQCHCPVMMRIPQADR